MAETNQVDIGPQRAAPSSPAKISAEIKQVNRVLGCTCSDDQPQDERCNCDGFCKGTCRGEQEDDQMGKLPCGVTVDTPMQQVMGPCIGDISRLAKADFR